MSEGQTAVQLVLLGAVQIALNDTGLFSAQESEPGTELTIVARGLPWRGAWRLTLEPIGDHRAAIIESLDRRG